MVKKVFNGREITASILHCSRIKSRSFLSLLRFIMPSGITIKAFFPGFRARTIHSINKPSMPMALMEKYFFRVSSLEISSFKLLLPLITYGGFVRIKSYSSVIGFANVPRIELVCSVKVLLNSSANCFVSPGCSLIIPDIYISIFAFARIIVFCSSLSKPLSNPEREI